MRRAIILRRRLSSLCTRKNHYHPTLNKNKLNNPTIPNYNNLIPPISIPQFPRFFSSEPDSSATQDAVLDDTQDVDLRQVEDVSNEELKMWIERYFKGDEDAISDIFDAIMRRKIAGKHGEDSDDEILKELREENPWNIASNKEVDSDFDDTDDEILKEIQQEKSSNVVSNEEVDLDFDDIDLEEEER